MRRTVRAESEGDALVGVQVTPPKDRAVEGILWRILSHNLAVGDRLPAERVLCEKIGVSRTALRGAIAQLVSSNVLESRQGSGTYVCPRKPVSIFQESYGYSDAVRKAGRTPGTHLIYARSCTLTEDLVDKIDLPVGSPVFMMRRVRLVDDVPTSIESATVNCALCPGIERYDFSRESLYDVLAAEYGVRVVHGDEHISIGRLTAEEAELLEEPEGTPVFFVSAIKRDADYNPVEYVKKVVMPTRLHFVSNGMPNGVKAEVGAEWLRS